MSTFLRPTAHTWRRAAVLLAASAACAVAAAPASAVTPQDEYASHVVTCQRHHGFDGVMNPGMHQGRSGWDPDHSC